MNDLRDLFHATADDAPQPRALAERAHARAAGRRGHTRRRTAYALAGAVALAAGAGAVALREPSPAPVYVALGADGVAQVAADAEDCRGTSSRVSGTELAPELRLVSTDPDLVQARPALARRMTTTGCTTAAVPLALLQNDADGGTLRRLTLSGPLPERLPVGPADGHTAVVRGGTGLVLVAQGRATAVTWDESDGEAWVLYSTGNTEAELLAYAEALDLSRTGRAMLPAAMTEGMTDLGSAPERRDAPRDAWYLSYRNADGREIEIEAVTRTGPPLAWLAGGRPDLTREVTVNGHRAAYFTNGETFGHGLQILQWESSPGVVAAASGVGLRLDELMELATSVEPAPAGHPAVTSTN